MNDGLLTSIEVLELIEERRSSRDIRRGSMSDLYLRENVEIQTVEKLRSSFPPGFSTQRAVECLKRLKSLDFDLTEAELIQIVNLLPKHPVEIHLVS